KREPVQKRDTMYPHIAKCDYFTVDKINLDGKLFDKMEGFVTEESFLSILVLDGEGTIQNQFGSLSYKKGDSLFLPAGSGSYQIVGRCDALVTTVGKKEDMVSLGIDIGGTSAKIGIVDKENRVIAETKVVTGVKKAEEIIENIAKAALQLMEEHNISMEQCGKVGVGVPGLVDKKEGMVLYSNNLQWENVKLAEEFKKYLPLPVSIANDADCAALGEAVAGAGRGVQNLVMLTLGTGVGGGVILNGQLFTGSILGGIELGHMVIHEKGELCTCGRRGCLEAYASATAMRREAKKVYGTSLEPLEIFEKANASDEKAKVIVHNYIQDLGTGVINLVNVFRPERIIFGGGIAAQGEVILQPIRERMEKESFGGNYSEVPELVIAEMENQAGMIGAANL
ncbi:MAG: ROK family protein, partial [Firmicutes bacterium]|nr:ROK family protein [Candidatus Scybalomonas excrementavium]